MKRNIVLFLCVIMMSVLIGCSSDIAEGSTHNSTQNYLETNVITADEALYLAKAEYSGTDYNTGYSFSMEYKGKDSYNNLEFYVFSCGLVDDDNEFKGSLSDVWVAIDGSYTTTLESLENIDDSFQMHESEDESYNYDDDFYEDTGNTSSDYEAYTDEIN